MSKSREEVEDTLGRHTKECQLSRLVKIVEELAGKLDCHVNNHDIIITEEEKFEATEAGKEVVCSESETTTHEPTEEELIGKVCYCWDHDSTDCSVERVLDYCNDELNENTKLYRTENTRWYHARIVPKDELLEMQEYEEELCEWEWDEQNKCRYACCPDCGKKVKVIN